MQAKSASVPFLTRPAKLDGSIVGDAGFDPLGFTEKYDLTLDQALALKLLRDRSNRRVTEDRRLARLRKEDLRE